MKKLLVILVGLLIPISVSSQGLPSRMQVDDVEIYVPSQEEVNNYISFTKFLVSLELNKKDINIDSMKRLISIYYGNKTLLGQLFESYLLYTKNDKIRLLVLDGLDSIGVADDFSNTLKRLYSSTPVEYLSDGKKIIKYQCQDGMWDENVNYFLAKESGTFKGSLGFMLLENEWAALSFTGLTDSKKEDSFSMLCGGGTNSICIRYTKFSYGEEEFVKYIEDRNEGFYQKGYENWNFAEMAITGELERSGADRVFVGIGYGQDVMDLINSGRFVIYLYDREKGIGFAIEYYVNISKINNNYSIFSKILNRLAMMLSLTFIE